MLVTGNGWKRHFRLVEAPYGHPVGRTGSRYSDTSDYCGDRYIETFLFRSFPVFIFPLASFRVSDLISLSNAMVSLHFNADLCSGNQSQLKSTMIHRIMSLPHLSI